MVAGYLNKNKNVQTQIRKTVTKSNSQWGTQNWLRLSAHFWKQFKDVLILPRHYLASVTQRLRFTWIWRYIN